MMDICRMHQRKFSLSLFRLVMVLHVFSKGKYAFDHWLNIIQKQPETFKDLILLIDSRLNLLFRNHSSKTLLKLKNDKII